MRRLAVFCRDTRTYEACDVIGTGEVNRLHYRPPRGFFKKRREEKLLSSFADGMEGVQPDFCILSGIPCIKGDASRLVFAHLPALLGKKAERIALYPGEALSGNLLTALSEHVRFLEIVGDARHERLAEDILIETGICIPVRTMPSEGFLSVRLPGAAKGRGLDLTEPELACRFLPPAPLREVWPYVPKTGATLDALLQFFELSPLSAGVFLSNFTK